MKLTTKQKDKIIDTAYNGNSDLLLKMIQKLLTEAYNKGSKEIQSELYGTDR